MRITTRPCKTCNKVLPCTSYENKKRICNDCLPNAKNNGGKPCQHDGCKTAANFGNPGGKPVFCDIHAAPGMVDVKNRKCKHAGCTTQPVYNMPGEKAGLYCMTHKLEGMINVTHKKICQADDCTKQACFGFMGQVAVACRQHKTPEMIDLENRKCESQGCLRQPMFNHPGESRGKFCKLHKDPEMIDVLNPKCQADGCLTKPIFNYKNESRAAYCASHRLKEMVDVCHKLCSSDGCTKRPYFNFPGEKARLFCSVHAQQGMVDLDHKVCEAQGCTRQSYYNNPNQKKPAFCREHAALGMIPISNKKLCEIDGCTTRAACGYIGQLQTHCKRHGKQIPGVFQNQNRECTEEDCKEKATHGEKEPTHCEDHATPSEFCLLRKLCTGSQCPKPCEPHILNKNGLCEYCEPTLRFQQVKTMARAKEAAALTYLDKHLKTDCAKIDDKIIDSACNKKRPDRVYDCGTHWTVVEIDENQHAGYDAGGANCEKNRMLAIQEAAGLHCAFLRFNPDGFKVDGQPQKVHATERHKTLLKWVKECISKKPTDDFAPPQVKYLYYNEFDPADTSFQTLAEGGLEKIFGGLRL